MVVSWRDRIGPDGVNIMEIEAYLATVEGVHNPRDGDSAARELYWYAIVLLDQEFKCDALNLGLRELARTAGASDQVGLRQ